MKLPRFVGIVDLSVVVFLAIMLPICSSPRSMQATDAVKGSDAERFALAYAEAHVIADPASSARAADLSERLGRAGHRDWAVETAVRGAERAKGSPDRWRVLSAASVAYVDRIDVHPALDYIERALSSCEANRETCADWERIRMELYRQNLDAGIKSGIDPHKDPVGFRKAGENGFRTVRLSPAHPK